MIGEERHWLPFSSPILDASLIYLTRIRSGALGFSKNEQTRIVGFSVRGRSSNMG